MSIETILLLDTETTGLSPETDRIVEVGLVRWSVTHRAVLSTWSELVQGPDNAARGVNGIPPEALPLGTTLERALAIIDRYAKRSDIIVAQRAEFDRSFIEAAGLTIGPWVCSKFDVEWPEGKPGDGLIGLALAHGVPVTGAHRALTDCLLLARLFERVAEKHDVRAMLERAMLPRQTYQATVSYDDREKAKAAGFAWDGATKRWTLRLTPEAAAALPFPVVEIR
jgi:DNA polymerase-3 subunit epsilon